MEKLMDLAGFFTAHAVWTISEQHGPLAPVLVTESKGERSLQRFENAESMELAVAEAQGLLDENPKGEERGIIMYDAYVTLEEKRMDAVIVHGIEYQDSILKIEIIQPYNPPNSKTGFALLQPKVSFPEAEVENAEKLIESFFKGLDSHEEGGPIWSAHILDKDDDK